MVLIIDERNWEKYLVLAPSTIVGAGSGLFARVDILAQARIGQYYGEEISAEEYDRRENKQYMFEVTHWPSRTRVSYIDGSDPLLSGYTRYINGALDATQESLINTKFYQYRKKIFVKATCDIKAGDEIIIPYGESYFLEN